MHFDGDVLVGLSRVVAKKIDRRLSRPPHRMHPGIPHEPHRAPHFKAELPEFRVRVFIHAELFAEALRIKPPALDERRVAGVLSEFRLALLPLPKGYLQIMSSTELFHGAHLHLPFPPPPQFYSLL